MKKCATKKQIMIVICSIAIFIFAGKIFAQSPTNIDSIINTYIGDLDKNFEVRQNPRYPTPNQTVSLEVISYAMDLSRSNIKWEYMDGTFTESIGLTKTTVKMGKIGETETIKVTIQTPDERVASKQIILTSSDVDILWHANSSVTPFYKGKPLFIEGGNITFTALPNVFDQNGNKINEKNLIYNWELNNKALQEFSGFGKNSFSINWTARQNSMLGVTIQSIDGSVNIRKLVVVNPFEPEIEMYETNLLYGEMLHQAIPDEFILEKEDIIIKTYPYFFDRSDIMDGKNEYRWTIDGIKSAEKSPEILLTTQGLTGTSNIYLSVINRDKIISVDKRKAIIIK